MTPTKIATTGATGSSRPIAPSLTIVRHFAAGPERVFAAWTEPAALKSWFGPSDAMTIEVAETDVRVGGRYRIHMQAPDGEMHRVGGTYREVEPGRRLVFTWAWESTPERESIVTVELEPSGNGTRLTLTHEQFFDEAARDRHQQGWNGTLDRLARQLSG